MRLLFTLSFAAIAAGCQPSDDSKVGSDTDDTASDDQVEVPVPDVAEFGFEGEAAFTIVASADDALNVPRDLAFNPMKPGELWVVNRADDSAVIIADAGGGDQTSEWRKDIYANHFMEEVSSLSFAPNEQFGTCQESRNTYDGAYRADNFMGPTLWPSSLEYFAEINQSPRSPLLGSHLDMLHQSPNCMGIAWDHDNAYWVFDGYNGHLVYYDYQTDHGYGGDDHSDGIVLRYKEVELTRVEDVPGHLALDADSGWLYIADTGTGRVLRVDIASGEQGDDLRARNEPLGVFAEWVDVTFETFVEGLGEPSGLALADGRLFVSDHASGEIMAYDLESGEELGRLATEATGLMGVEIGPDGDLWYVDAAAYTVVRVDPDGAD